MVANPHSPRKWERPEDGECSEDTWRKITRPIEKTKCTFSAFQNQKKMQKKIKIKREKKEIHHKQTHRHQLNRIQRILDRLLCL
ncbi:ORF4 [Anelloviridae sp.]|nr:ORF4 [Anelloviridae sp.]